MSVFCLHMVCIVFLCLRATFTVFAFITCCDVNSLQQQCIFRNEKRDARYLRTEKVSTRLSRLMEISLSEKS